MKISGPNRYIQGDHNVICDRTGQKVKRSDCRYEWNGLLVRKDVWEAKQPQLDIRGKDEQIAVPDTRPRGVTRFFVPTEEDL